MGQAGRLGLAVVGGFAGLPYGLGGLGFAVGAIAGGILFPVKQRLPDQNGPRLNDLQLTNSQYGQGIPKIWGTYKVPGNVIWASPVEETRRSTTQRIRQGKGGSKTQQTIHEFIYTQSFALALCEGVAKRVTKIFFDGQPVYDVTETQGSTMAEGLRFRFYPGDDAQMPDSIIEAHEGVGNVPAHRGLCYLVFDDLDITNYRRIPMVEVHVQMVGSDRVEQRSFDNTPGSGAINMDSRVRLNAPVNGPEQLLSLDDLQILREQESGYLKPLGPAPNGDFFVADGDLFSRNFHLVDGATLQVKLTRTPPTFGGMFDRLYARSMYARYCSFLHFGVLGREHLIFIGHKDTVPTLFAVDMYENASNVVIRNLPEDGLIVNCSCHAIFDRNYLVVVPSGGADHFFIYETSVSEDVSADPISGEMQTTITIQLTNRATITAADIDPDGKVPWFFPNRNIDGVLYDSSDDSLLMSFGEYLVTVKISCANWAIKWCYVSDENGSIDYFNSLFDLPYGHNVSAGTWFIHRQGHECIIDLTTGEPVKKFVFGEIPIIAQYVYDSRNKVAFSVNNSSVLYFDRAPDDRVPVSEILEDLRIEVDALPSDYSGISDVEVDGYARMSPSTARAMIEPLASAFGFDGVDAGTYLRWVSRGGDAIVDVVRDSLIPADPDTIEFQRIQEIELPRLVSITYADIDRDFESSTYHASRYYGNEQYTTMYSNNQVSIEAPMAINATEVKRRADAMLREAWNSRDSAKFSIPRYFLEYEVGDVVTLMSPGRVPQDVRLDGFAVGLNLAIEINATSQDSSQYTSVVEAEEGLGRVDQGILSSRDVLTRLFILPVPLLLDSSDRARQETLVHFALGALSPRWQAGVLEHDNGSGFVPVSSVQSDAAHGSVVGFVPAASPDAVFATNESLTIRVAMANGTLESVTQHEMLGGVNAAAIIHSDSRAEVIQFRDAVLDDDGNYALSGILRGRRGTDYWATTFDSPSGATFVLLAQDAANATTVPLSDLGRSRLYRAHEIRQDPINGDTRSAVIGGYDLMPYAVAHLSFSGAVGSDISLTWERRTRIRGDLADGTGIVPLNEDAESYEIDVIKNGVVVRTIASSTPGAIYTSAQQAEDGIDASVILDAVVYQMSAQADRGFPTRVRVHGTSIDVAQQSSVVAYALGAPDVEVAQQSTIVMQTLESSLHIAQQSVILLHEEFELPPMDVVQQSNVVVFDMSSPQNMDVAQQSNIILYEV